MNLSSVFAPQTSAPGSTRQPLPCTRPQSHRRRHACLLHAPATPVQATPIPRSAVQHQNSPQVLLPPPRAAHVDAPTDAAFPKDLESLQPGTLLHVPSTQGFNSEEVYLETLSGWDPSSRSFTAAWQGRLLKLSPDGDCLLPTCIGTYPDPRHPALSKFPGWQALLQRHAPQLQSSLPWQQLPLSSARAVKTLDQLRGEVAAQPHLWCSGTGPSDPMPTGLDYQLMNAGELIALSQGHRGVAMVQVYVGWGGNSGASTPQPVYNPFVVTLMLEAAASKAITVTMSTAPGGLGLTALLTPDKDPFRSWAKYLAGIGAQAAVVAESPFYKLLIGRMLGYKEDNILHHIKATNGPMHPSAQVITAVGKEMQSISRKKATLPWNVPSRGKKQ